jgi:uncharacterized BrkB/YihY/UPF0761 family membrane protein
VHWLDALRGGLLAALVWEVGRDVLGAFFIGMRYTTAYGAIGSFIALLLWCYYGISILFFGAEYVQILESRRRERLSGEQAGGIQGGRGFDARIDASLYHRSSHGSDAGAAAHASTA